MGDIQNVNGEAAIKKIKELAEDAKNCMYCTNLSQVPFSTRPMAIQEVDDNGILWFFSAADSKKNEQIMEDERAQLIFMNNGTNEYLTLFGDTAIITDQKRATELWTAQATNWFPIGVEDPNLTLIKFTPEYGHYWDIKNNTFAALAKMAVGSLTGQTTDLGIEEEVSP